MRTYRFPGGGWARALRHLGVLVATLAYASNTQAQERRNLFEASAAGGYQAYDSIAGLGSTFGGLLRIGLWLPLNFSVEAEGSTASAKPKTTDTKIGVKTGSASLLYNLPLGARNWGYAKLGFGGTKYGGDCAVSGATICGTTTMFVAGLGARVGLTPILMVRAEGVIQPNRGKTRTGSTVTFSNYGVNLGVSLMLGSKPIPDSDGDGILNNRDRCTGTPAGAQVDGRGCPADGDGDGVPNGVDRCPSSGSGALVDATGCGQDSDGDNIADGIDRCADTPTGVLVDAIGCPRDNDGDSIADGLDRCSDTPKGATVDALGCPGDEDGDGTLDGLDRCPRTPAGASVNAAGCAAGQQGRQQPAPRVDTSAVRPPQPRPQPQPQPQPQPSGQAMGGGRPMVLEGVTFGTGSARLQASAYVVLDSIAKVLAANPSLRVEIGGHTDEGGTPADNMHLSNLRAEAVRNYLVAKGVPFQQMVARGYGSSMPRTPDTTPRGRATNRRVEIRPIATDQ